MCIVDNGVKLVSSCTAVVEDNPKIFTNNPKVLKARENVLESLLLNHPLDCPICDQGGECDLQDQVVLYGGHSSRHFYHKKRSVEDKECGPLIKTIMTRCIHCTRCVRFSSEIAGIDYFGTINRGSSTEIGNYIPDTFDSEISGNVIDLCPVGALTSKPYAFKARPWELKLIESIDLSDGLGSNIYLNFKESEIVRILPKNNASINENWITDKARFCFDALKTKRLTTPIFFHNSTNLWKKIRWNVLTEKMSSVLKKEKSLIIIDEDIDTKTLKVLKNLQNLYSNNVRIRKLNTNLQKDTFESNYSKEKISAINDSIEVCFIIGSNLKTENAILNSKLRSKYLNENLAFLNLGLAQKSNIPIKTLNLRIENIFEVIEGKSLISSLVYKKKKTPLFLIGNSTKKRIKNFNLLIKTLQTSVPFCRFFSLETKSNACGISFLGGVKKLSKMDLKSIDNILLINLSDHFDIRKILNLKNKTFYWFNSHFPEFILQKTLKKNSCFLLPVLSYYEEENLFLNLERRPQKTLKGISGPMNSRSLKKFFNFFMKTPFNTTKILNHVEELIVNFSLNDLKFLFFNKETNNTIVNLHPFKRILDDHYRSNNLLRHSISMAKSSQQNRKKNFNF